MHADDARFALDVDDLRFARPDLERRRAAEQITLHHLATGGPEQRRLALGFDAFGDDADAERPRQPDDGRDDGARVGIRVDAAD